MSQTSNLEAAANAVVEDLASDVHGVLSGKDLESLPQLKAVGRLSAGAENIDFDAAIFQIGRRRPDLPIPVANVGGPFQEIR